MKLGVVVNRVDQIKPEQTTASLASRAAARGHEVWVWGAGEHTLEPDGSVAVAARPWLAGRNATAELELVRGARPEPLDAGTLDLALLRLNPGRESRRGVSELALDFARILRTAGVVVLNDPDALTRAATKLYLHRVPARFRPETIVTRDLAVIRSFVETRGRAVLKPVVGTRGRDVFLLDGGRAQNLNQIVDVLTRDGGFAMVQEFVPEATAGDVRLVVMGGELLSVDGAAVAVRRTPGKGDFRSNVHVGGTAGPTEVTPAMKACVSAVGPILDADGLFLTGLDFIGGKLVEINVFSTGGIVDAEVFYERDFVGGVIDALESRATD